MAALAWGECVIEADTAGFVAAPSPVCTALLAALFLGARVRCPAGLGMDVGPGGEALIAFGAGHVGSISPGIAPVVVSAIATAACFVVETPLLAVRPASRVTAWVTWAGTLPFLVLVPGAWAQVAAAPPATLWTAVHLGDMPAAVGYVLWAYAMSRLPTDRVMNLLYLNPLLAATIAELWPGERPGSSTLAGGVLVVAGVVVVQGERRHPSAPPRHAPAPPGVPEAGPMP